MTAKFYNSGLQKVWNGTFGPLHTADIRCLMVTASHTFDETDDFVSDLDNELSGGNYARVTSTGRVVNLDDTNDGATLDGNDITFPSLQLAAGTPTHLIFFLQVGADSTNILLCALALPGDGPNGNNYVCQLQAAGICYIRNVAGAGGAFNSGVVAIMENTVDLLTDTVNHTLHTSSYVPNLDTHDTYADLTDELSGGNYAEQAIDTPVVNLDDVNDGAVWDAVDPLFPSLQAAAGTPAVMVTHSETDSDQLICHTTLTTPDTPDNNNYNILLAAGATEGLLRVRNSAS